MPLRRNVKPKDITAVGTGITPGRAFTQHLSNTKIDLQLLKNRTGRTQCRNGMEGWWPWRPSTHGAEKMPPSALQELHVG